MRAFLTLLLFFSLALPAQAEPLETKQTAGLPGRFALAEVRSLQNAPDDDTIGETVREAAKDFNAPHCQVAFYQNGKKTGQGVLAIGETKDGSTVSILRPQNEKEAKWLEKLLALPTTPNLLATAYLENQIRADDDYHKKVVLFEGTVAEIAKGAFNQPYVFFPKEEGADTGLTCYFAPSSPELRKIRKGSKILVRGVVKEFLMQDVILERCEILGNAPAQPAS